MKPKLLQIAPGLDLPADEAVTQTIALIAKRGVGKTFTAMKLTEELIEAGKVVTVIDPVGVCWGLRSSANGKAPGYPVLVLGGAHGDVPLEAAAGELIADLVVDARRSCVLDLSELRKGESIRFMTDFAERLFHRNREPLHLVIDEADAFAPQRPQHNEARMLGAMEDLIRRGRARGIGLTLTTQRAAVLNKNVLTQCEVLVTLRTIAPQDLEAVDAWIKVHGTPAQRAEMMASLPSLPVGEAWWWSPAWRNLFLRTKASARRTFDSSATPTGQAAAAPRKMAEVNLEELRGRLAEVAARAKADNPRELKRRVAELEAQLRAAAKPATVDRVVEVPVLKPADLKRLEAAVQALDARASRIETAAATLRTAQQELTAKMQLAQSAARVPLTTGRQPISPTPARRPLAVATVRAREDLPAFGAGEIRVLTAVAQYGDAGASRETITVLTGYKRSSRDTYLQRLNAQGLVGRSGDVFLATLAGVRALGTDFEPLPTGHALQAHWLDRLPEGERAILEVLLQNRQGLTRDEISERVPYKRSSRDTYLQRMGARRIVVYGPGSTVQPAPELFS